MKQLTITTFAKVAQGQLFYQNGNTRMFLKTADRGVLCDCGHGLNAYNLETLNPFTVHFHDDSLVRVAPDASIVEELGENND